MNPRRCRRHSEWVSGHLEFALAPCRWNLALLELSELCQGVPSKAQLLAAKAKSGSFEKCLGRISCRPRVYPNSKARQMPLLRQISRGGKQRVLFDHVCMFALWFKDFLYFRAAFQLAGGVGLSSNTLRSQGSKQHIHASLQTRLSIIFLFVCNYVTAVHHTVREQSQRTYDCKQSSMKYVNDLQQEAACLGFRGKSHTLHSLVPFKLLYTIPKCRGLK